MSKKEDSSKAAVPNFVFAPAPNVEGPKDGGEDKVGDAAKCHHTKSTATKTEIEKTLKVRHQSMSPGNAFFFC